MRNNSLRVFEAIAAYWQVHKRPALPRHVSYISGIVGNRLAPYRRDLEAHGYVEVKFIHNPNGGCNMATYKPLKACNVSDEYLERARNCPEVTQAMITASKLVAASESRKSRTHLQESIDRVVAKALGGIGTMGASVDPFHDYRRPLARGSIHILRKF